METLSRTLDEELAAFYARSGFGAVIGARPCTVKVYTGCLLVPLPNTMPLSTSRPNHIMIIHSLIPGLLWKVI